ncbi:hypothetical protein [Parvibaculum sp.]|uniref:hypothetical protein n=1 Tax=Parvibaculum sp. TaxID=2024848 RepID=UPI00320C9846
MRFLRSGGALRAALAASVGLVAAAGANNSAWAGAWPMAEGDLLVIMPLSATRANDAYGATGKVVPHSDYRKVELAPYLEYGLTSNITLLSSLALTRDTTDYFGYEFTQQSISRLELGARVDLGEWRETRFALQGLAVRHGATSGDDPFSSRRGDIDGEIGLFMGRNFTLLGMKGFTDTYGGYRYRPGGRPGEAKLNVTVGTRPLVSTMLLMKAESSTSIGKVQAEDTVQRVAASKLGLSIMQQFTDSISLELGGMRTIAGQNSLRQTTLTLGLWYRL